MIIKDYYDIKNVNIDDTIKHLYFTSRENSKYIQQIKLGFLYLFNVYKGNSKNKSFDISINDIQLTPNNTQLRFIPADVYYKRDMEYGSNSVLLNVLLNILKYNPKYNEYIQEIYTLIDDKFSLNINIDYDVNLSIEADEVNLKKLINLLEIKLLTKERELEEIDLTEYQLKSLYLEILNLMSVETEKVIYLIESPEAGLNYREKVLFMNKISKLEYVLIFTNDVDILKHSNDIRKVNIIDDKEFYFFMDKLIEDVSSMFEGKTKDEIQLEISRILIDNLGLVLKQGNINDIIDVKERNIVLNYLNLLIKK